MIAVTEDEVRTPTEEAFTAAIKALTQLHICAIDSGNASLKARVEASTAKLLGWINEPRNNEPRSEEREMRENTRLDFPPQQETTQR